jgi:NAD(P)-dependent dehydrogenase (short-subunit alcohol dehydrogenase family)
MDFASVKKAADAVKQQFPGGIDILCNNAGIMAVEDKATKDGMHVSHVEMMNSCYNCIT